MVKVACNVASALLKVPNADTCAVNAVWRRFSALVSAAPAEVVSEDTIALISRPDPIPVDEMAELIKSSGAIVLNELSANHLQT